MRTVTGGEQTILDGVAYSVHFRVKVANGSGTLKDLSSLGGTNWCLGATIDENIDRPTAQATVKLRREIDAATVLSLAPLRSDSTLNVLDDGTTYSPLVYLGREIRIEVATVDISASPSGGDWKLLFKGGIDTVDWDGETIEVVARDDGRVLQDKWIELGGNYGSLGGTAIQTVIQNVINDNVTSPPTLYTPVSPGFNVVTYRIENSSKSVMEAITELAQSIGWEVRYRWDDGTSSFRLTFAQPDRAKSTPDYTHAPSRYIEIRQLALDITNVRNKVQVDFKFATDGSTGQAVASDGTSQSKYGVRYMRIVEGDGSPIDTQAEADALAAAALADLKEPKEDQEVERLLFWPTQLGDLYRFPSNSVHYNANQDLAVVGARHTLGLTEARTTLITRGQPAAYGLAWLTRDTGGGETFAGETLQIKPRLTDGTSQFTATVTVDATAPNGGSPTVQLIAVQGTAALNTGPAIGVASPSGQAWIFTKGENSTGSSQIQFRAVLAGYQSVDGFVEIPPAFRVLRPPIHVIGDPVAGGIAHLDPTIPFEGGTKTGEKPESQEGASGKAGAGGGGGFSDRWTGSGGGGVMTPGRPAIPWTTWDQTGFKVIGDPVSFQFPNTTLKGPDGKAPLESTFGAKTKASDASGVGGSGIALEAHVRAGSGGTPTPGKRIITDTYWDVTGFINLLDPVAQKITTGLKYQNGTGVDALRPAEAGANVTETRTANDVQVGVGKAVLETGANKTETRTSADTSAVNAVAAATVQGYANRAGLGLNTGGALTGGLSGNQDSSGKVYFTSSNPPSVGTAGSPGTITKTIRFTGAEFVPIDNAQVWKFSTTNYGVYHDTTNTTYKLVAPAVFPIGITLTVFRANLFRGGYSGEIAEAVLYRIDESGKTTLATLTKNSGIGGSTLSASISETVGTSYGYVVLLTLTETSGALQQVGLSWMECDYTVPSFDKGY